MRKNIKKLPKFVLKDFQSSFWMKTATVLPTHLHSNLSNRHSEKTVQLPKMFGKYKLVKDLQDDKPYPFKIGLYKNGNKFVVGKVWVGSIKNLHYYNIINEIVATHTLTKARNRLEKKLPRKLNNVFTPSYVDVVVKGKTVVFFTEFLRGRPFGKYSKREKLDVYNKSVSYLQFIGKNLNNNEKKLIRLKTTKEFLFQYPIILIAAIVRRAYLLPTLLRGMLIFVSNIRLLFESEDYVVVHGDLNRDNILYNGKDISIIDIEQLMYTYQEYEDVTTISSARCDKDVNDLIARKIINSASKDKTLAKLYSIFLIVCETHNLTGNSSFISYKNHIKKFSLGLLIDKYLVRGRRGTGIEDDFSGLSKVYV